MAYLTREQLSFVRSCIPEFESESWKVTEAGHAGSDRKFFRIVPPCGEKNLSWVLVVWNSADPDWPRFLGIASELGPHTPVLPHIIAADEKLGVILEEDLGEKTLLGECRGAESTVVEKRYCQVLDALVGWQALDPSLSPTIRSRAMDVATFLWESDYFAQHCVVQRFGRSDLLTSAWEEERVRLAHRTAALPHVCMHRDFQSENIIVNADKIRFVDFQGARLGPAYYDVASLLYDPYAEFLEISLVERLISYYRTICGRDERNALWSCAVQRLMQALGAYCNLALNKNKPRYLAFVPTALKRLRHILEQCSDLVYTRKIVGICEAECK